MNQIFPKIKIRYFPSIFKSLPKNGIYFESEMEKAKKKNVNKDSDKNENK